MQLLSSALKAMDSLREQAKGSKDYTLKENISNLYDTLLDMKAAVLRVEEENAELRARIRELEESPQSDPCPRCRSLVGSLRRVNRTRCLVRWD